MNETETGTLIIDRNKVDELSARLFSMLQKSDITVYLDSDSTHGSV